MTKAMSWDAFFSTAHPVRTITPVLLKKAERVYEFTQWVLQNNPHVDDSVIGGIYHAAELYVGGIQELLSGQLSNDIYGKGNIPHDLGRRYCDILTLPMAKELKISFEQEFYRKLGSLYAEWKDTRYGVGGNDIRISEEDMTYYVDTLTRVKELCDTVVSRYNDYLLENQREQIDMKKKKHNRHIERD